MARTATARYHGGPLDGDTQPLQHHGAMPPTERQHEGGLYRLAVIQSGGDATYAWQHTHAGRKRRPDKPCCEPARPGCPLWKPGASP